MEKTPSPVARDTHHSDMGTKTSVAGHTVLLPSDDCPTPPHSARESHCESLVFSCFSDTSSSGPSSVGNFSVAATPDIMAGHYNHLFPRNGVHEKTHISLRDELRIQTHQNHAQDNALCQGVDSNLCDANIDRDSPSHNVSIHSNHTTPIIRDRGVWLTAGALSTDVCTPRSFNCESDTSLHTIPAGPAHLRISTSSSIESPWYSQAPQVIIPSQSSPTDELALKNYSSYTNPNLGDDRCDGSFCSKEDTFSQFKTDALGGFEEVYIGNPEEVNGPMIKDERTA